MFFFFWTGEFFFEASSQLLYYFHNATSGTPPPTTWTWEAPFLQTLFNLSGTAAEPVLDISFEGLGFTATAASFLGPHGIPSGGGRH